MIKAVLFDLGGTLHVSSMPEGRWEWFAGVLLTRLADYGIVLNTTPEALAASLRENSEIYKHETEKNLREYPQDIIWNDYFLKEFGIGRERLAPIAEELSFRFDYERPVVVRRPNLTETMDRLQGMGIRLGMISNIISASVVPHFLAEYGLGDRMECIIMSSTEGVRKPSAEIFRRAEKALGLKPEELAYVGDTISRDVMGCRNAGWHTMIRIRGAGTSHRDAGLENSGYEPDYEIDDLSEIPAIIARENAKGE